MEKGKRRSSGQLARDRRRIADLYLQGWLQVDIAAELDLNQSTISRDLKALYGVWLQSALVDFDEAKANELAKIDRLEREYWDAWGRSRLDAETETVKEGIDADVREYSEKVFQIKGQVGSVSFLRGIQWCIEQRCKILGVEAPVVLEHQGEVKTVVQVIGGVDFAQALPPMPETPDEDEDT